jgi:hypothetical protein
MLCHSFIHSFIQTNNVRNNLIFLTLAVPKAFSYLQDQMRRELEPLETRSPTKPKQSRAPGWSAGPRAWQGRRDSRAPSSILLVYKEVGNHEDERSPRL